MESVAGIVGRVTALSHDLGLPGDRAYKLRLATEEMATNVVVHGYGEAHERSPHPTIDMEWGNDTEQVWVRLVDGAPPFDPTAAPAPVGLDTPLSERTIGGLGIHLAKASLDDFSYERTGGRNRVTLVLKRNP